MTPELIEAIAKRIRVGSFPYIAAAACGIPKSTYYTWMRKAEQKGAPKLYRELLHRITEAAAAARADAEIRVYRDQPFQWLRYGPGKDRGPEEPGWTETPTTVRLEGGNTPVRVEHERVNPLENLPGALAVLEHLGIIKVLDPPEAIEAEEGAEDGSVIDVDFDDNGKE
ncbi:MAG: hypothetical protein ACYTG0_15315 [Planctomycetota bacterium]